MARNQVAFLPTQAQEQLLKACLLDAEEAIAAWRTWRAASDLEQIDLGSIRLLPLLADSLGRLGVTDPWFARCRGLQRRTWARNQMLFRGAALATTQLRAAGVVCMCLKGVSLASTYYDRDSLRPMGDVDLLVRREQALPALDVLLGAGWRLHPTDRRPRSAAELAVAHAYPVTHPSNPEVSVDLHWRPLWASHSDEAESCLWDRATEVRIANTNMTAPCAADMLIHVCAHGARWNDFPMLRWVVDAAMVLRANATDWAYLRGQTIRFGLTLPISTTLGYLRSTMRLSIPPAVIRDLAEWPTTPLDRFLYVSQARSPARWSLLTRLRVHRHIARHHLTRTVGMRGYWRYLRALRRGRSLTELVAMTYKRMGTQ